MSKLLDRLPYILDDYEIEDLLNQFNITSYTGLRNYCMISLMVYSGLTTQNIVELKWDDVGLYEGYVFIRDYDNPKNNREALVDFETLELLRDLKQIQAIESFRHHLVFTTKEGNTLCENYITEMVRRYAKRAALPDCVNTYTLRHTFATNVYKRTKSLKKVQEVMGYSRKDVGTKYKYLASEEIMTNY